jgi:hypothetical protein
MYRRNSPFPHVNEIVVGPNYGEAGVFPTQAQWTEGGYRGYQFPAYVPKQARIRPPDLYRELHSLLSRFWIIEHDIHQAMKHVRGRPLGMPKESRRHMTGRPRKLSTKEEIAYLSNLETVIRALKAQGQPASTAAALRVMSSRANVRTQSMYVSRLRKRHKTTK